MAGHRTELLNSQSKMNSQTVSCYMVREKEKMKLAIYREKSSEHSVILACM